MKLLQYLTPSQVIESRVAAHGERDFATIYHSTHSASAFRSNFSALDDYLDYARQHLDNTIHIIEFSVVAEFTADESTYVSAKSICRRSSEITYFFELHQLQQEDNGWRLVASCRLPVSADAYRHDVVNIAAFNGQLWF